MQNPINPFATLFAIVLLVSIVGALLTELTIVLASAIIITVVGIYSGSKLHKSNYKDSPILQQYAKLLGWRVHNCGCVYQRNTSRHGTNVPNSEWIDKEKVYERSMKGAKVKFSKKKAGMKRCTQCGNHYHIVEKYSNRRNRHKRICWPEEEPDVREELNHKVIEQ